MQSRTMKHLFPALMFFCFTNYAKTCDVNDACYVSKMKLLLNSAVNFITDAQNLTEGLKNGEGFPTCLGRPIDCEEVLKCGKTNSGLYSVWPRNRISKEQEIQVFCDMDTDGGGWTVFQRRGDFGRPKDFFYKGWNEYKSGFGKKSEDFWLGNDDIFALSNQKLYSLRIDMKDLTNESRHAVYDNFWIDGEEYAYKLHVTGYTGNAGDSFSGHSEAKFTTKDKDNDVYEEGNCANLYKGGWWYTKCHSSNLNGLYLNGTHETYADGIEWHLWKGHNYSIPFVEMKIRSFSFDPSKYRKRTDITPA